MKKALSLIIFAFFPIFVSSAQTKEFKEYAQMISTEGLKELIISLADDQTEGRYSGTIGNMMAEQTIINCFRNNGISPYKRATYTHSFKKDSTIFRNIIGYLPSNKRSDEYIIICAHYDHLGKIGGAVYNGADDNASGVAALITLSKLFSQMKRKEKNLKKNILFVAFDGKEHNFAGSEQFIKSLTIPKRKIKCVINMDILGSKLVPPTTLEEYILILGDRFMTSEYKMDIRRINIRQDLDMCIDFTFYGSKNFTEIAYKMSDNYTFYKRGIPAILFTSGFHHHTYKPTDDLEIIDFQSLKKRILLIYGFTRQLILR